MGAPVWAVALCVAVVVVTGTASGLPGAEQRVVRRVAGKEGQDRTGRGHGPGGQKRPGSGTGA